MALHLRAEEKGTWPSTTAGATSASPDCSAATVAFAWGSAANVARAGRTAGSSPSTSIASSTTVPSVMVPVLSTHRTSTRARISTAGSSWTSTRVLARMAAARAKLIDVSSTSPSGIMPTTPATANTTARRQVPSAIACVSPPWLCNWLQNSSTVTGTMIQETATSTLLMPVRSSEVTRE